MMQMKKRTSNIVGNLVYQYKMILKKLLILIGTKILRYRRLDIGKDLTPNLGCVNYYGKSYWYYDKEGFWQCLFSMIKFSLNKGSKYELAKDIITKLQEVNSSDMTLECKLDTLIIGECRGDEEHKVNLQTAKNTHIDLYKGYVN